MKKMVLLFLFLLSVNFYGQYNYLGGWDDKGVPDYLEAENDIIDIELLARISASLPDGQRVPIHHPEYLAEGTQTNILVTETADVFVTFVGEGAGYRNVLGFYTYEVNNPPQTISDIEATMTIIFPNASLLHKGGGLVEGNKVKIGTFQQNTVIGWFLLANGFNSNTQEITNGNWRLFSNPNLNPEQDTLKKQHNILLNDLGSGRIVLGFEDIRRDSGSDEDFEDALFYVTSNPITAISYDDIPVIETPKEIADISVEKSIDNPNPFDGDAITYTIKAVNNGPDYATNIEIADLIPSGLSITGISVSAGSYDSETGLWLIDEMENNSEEILEISAIVNIASISQSAFDLGPAIGYNVFVWEDFTQPSADVEGKLAVGRSAYLSSFSVGDKLPDSGGQEDVLVVGKDLIFLSGTVTGGNVVYGKNTNLPIDQVSILHGELRKDNVINFGQARKHFRDLSLTLRDYDVTGTTTYINSGLELVGSEPFLNVFEVDGDTLSISTGMNINVPNGAVVLVNIDGVEINWGGALTVQGTAISNVLYNFYNAKEITIQGIDVRGTILAHRAQIEYPSGVINGQVIAKSIYGTGQFNSGFNYETHFVGNIPSDETILNAVEIISYEQEDPNPNNNYDEVALILGGYSSPNNTGNNNWQIAGTFSPGEIIWTMSEDKDENLITGTWGGKIYRTLDNGATWTRLNENMNVGFIWDLAVNENRIFAGTEMGLYLSSDNGENWAKSGLDSKDVRALHIANGKIYAGIWGDGIYISDDNGVSWTKIGRDILTASVHAIESDSEGNLYAGTFGEGVFRSVNEGADWEKLDFPYLYVWSMGITSDNVIYAGTYGGGVYSSSDNGLTWFGAGSNLPALYIYSIQVDEIDNVFVSGLSSGVYVLPSTTRNSAWGSLGMNGIEVSSIYYDNESGILFAGSSDGYLYTNQSPLVSVGDKEIVSPKVFNLSQNYPNPFNPSTIIEFSIPESGKYKLEVFDILGRMVKEIFDETVSEGVHSVSFNGEGLPSGVYIYQLSGNSNVISKKMLLIK